jgi:hypothetical protein
MPLANLQPQGTIGAAERRTPWIFAIAVASAVCGFVVLTALLAYLTRDGSGPVPRPAPVGTVEPPVVAVVEPVVVDAGPPVVVDAGPASYGPMTDPNLDAGVEEVAAPVERADYTVEPPPPSAAEAGPPLVAVVEKCFAEGLRYDPSLGGVLALHVDVAADGTLKTEVSSAASPFLARCVKQAAAGAKTATPPRRPGAVDVKMLLDAGMQKASLVIEP